MRYVKMLGMGLLVASLAVAGCSEKKGDTKTSKNGGVAKNIGQKEDDHAHGSGPNGGVVFDLGKYHAEFTVDHPATECTVLFLDGDGPDAKPLPVAAEEFTLSIAETKVTEGTSKGKTVAPMTVTLKPVDAKAGKASKFVGADPGIGNVADFAGTVVGEIEGKPSQGKFAE